MLTKTTYSSHSKAETALIDMTTSKNILSDFPRELRDQIFSYLLVSPSGVVSSYGPGPYPIKLRPWSIRTYSIDHDLERLEYMPLFLTCRQFFYECRKILCSKNALLINVAEIDRYIKVIQARESIWSHIEKVMLQAAHSGGSLMPGISSSGKCLGGAEPKLVRWARVGSLKQITLLFNDLSMLGFNFLDLLYLSHSLHDQGTELLPGPWYPGVITRKNFYHSVYKSMLAELKNSASILSSFKLKIYIHTKGIADKLCPKTHKFRDFDPNAVIRGLHNHFGSELWVDDWLCYKDGVELVKAFQEVPEQNPNHITMMTADGVREWQTISINNDTDSSDESYT
ncbi:hypothetical protein ACMFMG_004626 [Clarireedia jacksonii]